MHNAVQLLLTSKNDNRFSYSAVLAFASGIMLKTVLFCRYPGTKESAN